MEKGRKGERGRGEGDRREEGEGRMQEWERMDGQKFINLNQQPMLTWVISHHLMSMMLEDMNHNLHVCLY